jgi:hypothetical protein
MNFNNKSAWFIKGPVFTKDRDERAKQRKKNQQKILNERNIKMFLIKVIVLFTQFRNYFSIEFLTPFIKKM